METTKNTAIEAGQKSKRNYSNKVTIYRDLTDETHPYAKLSHKIFDDDRLNYLEKMIMLNIFKNSDNYVFNKDYDQKKSGFGEIQYNNAIKNLKKIGYLKSVKIQGGLHWIVRGFSFLDKPIEDEVTPLEITPSEIHTNESHTPRNPDQWKSTPVENDPLIINNDLEIKNKIIIKNENNINKDNNINNNNINNNIIIDNLKQIEEPTLEVKEKTISQPSVNSFFNLPRSFGKVKETEVSPIEAIKNELRDTEDPEEIYSIFEKWYSEAPGTPSDKLYDFKSIFSSEQIISIGEYMRQEGVTGYNSIKRVINEVTESVEEEEEKEYEYQF